MSYVKIRLPEISILKKEIEMNLTKLEFYSKFEILLGNSDSIDYLIQKIKENENKKN